MLLPFLMPLSSDFLYNLCFLLSDLIFSWITLSAKIGTLELPKPGLSESGYISVSTSLVSTFELKSSPFN